MKLEIRELDQKDYQKAIKFAVKGMSFDRYGENPAIINMYGKYFLYLELSKATQIIAAYMEDELVGLLLAEVYGEPKIKQTLGQKLYIKAFGFLQSLYASGGLGTYEATNKDLLNIYKSKTQPDGEILFLAADPDKKIKGVGTTLLKELEAREPGKEIFLYTDSGCTYQFYEHKGFILEGARDIQLKIGKSKTDLTAMLFSKKLTQR
jgi:ribosomal protein S18 acetylase RimI-like enzyme